MTPEEDRARRGESATAPYAAFAGFYDRLTSGFWEHHARTLDALLPLQGPEHPRALDLACGTGAGIGYLESRGFIAVGVDVAPEMLAVARQRWPGRQLHEADMRTLPAFSTFDAVICCFDSINYLLDPAEWRSLFERVRALLVDGGVFVFDTLRPDDLRDNWPDHCRVVEESGLVYVERCAYDEASLVGATRRTFFIQASGGGWFRHDEHHEQVAFERADIVGWLLDAGFDQVAVHDGESGAEGAPSSVRIVVQARAKTGPGCVTSPTEESLP